MVPSAPCSSHSPRVLISCGLCLTGAQVEGTTIPEAVPVEGVVPEAEVIAGSPSEPVGTPAPESTEEVHDDALPETSMDVVVRSLEIQDAEPFRSAPMSEAAGASRGGLKLLADDLINLATVARNLESMRRTKQLMKLLTVPLGSRVPPELSTPVIIVALCRMSWRDPDRNLICSRGMAI
jgi:hypothetical protein